MEPDVTKLLDSERGLQMKVGHYVGLVVLVAAAFYVGKKYPSLFGLLGS